MHQSQDGGQLRNSCNRVATPESSAEGLFSQWFIGLYCRSSRRNRLRKLNGSDLCLLLALWPSLQPPCYRCFFFCVHVSLWTQRVSETGEATLMSSVMLKVSITFFLLLKQAFAWCFWFPILSTLDMFFSPWPCWLVAFCGKQVSEVKGLTFPELAVFSNQHPFQCFEMGNLKERLDFWRAADGGRGRQHNEWVSRK